MVACPVDPSSASSHHKRKSLRSTLLTSKDPEIRSWPEERHKQWQKTKRQYEYSPMPRPGDYLAAFDECVTRSVADAATEICSVPQSDLEDVSEGVQNAFTELKYNLHRNYQIEPLLVLPFGNPCARIALVLNDASCNQVKDDTSHVPYGIEKSGLTAAKA